MNIPNTKKEPLINEILPYVVISIPVIIFLSFVHKYALNLPHWDDYDAVLAFMNSYKTAPINEKLALLFSQHNEHRIFSSRLVFVLYKGLFGSINFRHIIFINSFIIISVFGLLVYLVKQILPSLWQVAALALSICMFDLNNYENANFAMAGLQNFGIFMLFLYSMYFYSLSPNKFLIPAVILQMVCVFSSGNGSIGSLLITVFVFATGNNTKKIISTSVFLLITPLYYIAFSKGSADFFTLNPLKFIPYFLHSVGSHFGFKLGVVFSLVLLFLFVYLLPFNQDKSLKRLDSVSPFSVIFIFLALFIFASLGVMSIFRGNLPIESACSSRYLIYSHMLVAIVFIFFLIRYQDSVKLKSRSVVIILLLIVTYTFNYEEGEKGFVNFYNTTKNAQFDYPDPVRAKALTEESCKLNIYCIEQAKTQIQ
jgi:hypothetical protein